MPTVADLLAQTNQQLDALLADKPASTEQPEQKLAAADLIGEIAAELKAGNITKEREAYLREKLAEVSKGSFEGTGGVWTPAIRVINDPMQIKPETVKAPTIQSLQTAKPDSHWASNQNKVLSLKEKAEIIAKMIVSPDVIQKGQYSDKMDELKSFFGISDDDLKEEYELRWKVGDLVCALQQAVKLEQFVGKAAPRADTKKAAEPPAPASPVVWPQDMAKAKFDPKAKTFAKEPSPWDASDNPSSGRS